MEGSGAGSPVRRVVRRVVVGLGLVLGVCVLWSVIAVLSVRDDLTEARDVLTATRESANVEASRTQLAVAEADLDRASSRLRAPGPALAARLPWVGRPLRGVERSATAALDVVRGTRAVLAAAAPESGSLLVEGGLDVAALREVATALEAADRSSRDSVEDLLAQPTGGVPGFVRGPVRTAQRELAAVPDAFGRAAAAVRALTGVVGADEPRQLLLVLENNAELRGTGGIVTVFAEAVADDGRVDVGPFRDVEIAADSAKDAQRVASPEDYHRLWGRYLADTTLWKNANMSPDVPTSSAVLSNVVAASIGRRPTAVVWLDVPAIAKVLEATGPARLDDGTELTSENAVRTLLSDAYRSVPDTRDGQRQRRAQLRGVADAVLERILDGSASPAQLGLALADAARGRHLKLWSAEPDEQAGLVRGRLAGEVEPEEGGDLASFVVQNFGGGDREGNKLDYYGRRQVSVDVLVGRDRAVVTQEVALRNTAPARGLPRYVAGNLTPGLMNALVTLALPREAALLEFTREGRAVNTELLPEGRHQVVSDTVELAPGTTARWSLRYELPLEDGRYSLTAVPQPLAVDGGLSVDVRAAEGLHLVLDAPGRSLSDGRLTVSGPFARSTVLRATAAQPGLVRWVRDNARSFWDDPLG